MAEVAATYRSTTNDNHVTQDHNSKKGNKKASKNGNGSWSKEARRATKMAATDRARIAQEGQRDQREENHTKRVGAVPRMHAQAPQVPTGCWPGSRGISASSCSQPAAPETARR